MKYKLVSRYGNVIIETDSERKRDRLLDLGYTLDEGKEKSLDEMTVAELEAFAKENNIDLSGCSNKAEKLAAIKAAME